MPLFRAGNYAAPGRRGAARMAGGVRQGRCHFKQGSGRLELANRIFSSRWA